MRFASRNENSKKNRGGAEGAFVGCGVDGAAISVMVVVVRIVDGSVVLLAGFHANAVSATGRGERIVLSHDGPLMR